MLCLVSLQLVSTSKKGTGGEALIKSAILIIASPIQNTSIYISNSITNTWNDYIYLVNIKEENSSLKAQINDLVDKNTRLTEELSLSKRLKILLEFSQTLKHKTVAATVLAFSSYGSGGSWTRTATINKGTKHGIEKNMPVISHQGVVGRVIEARNNTSTILLLTDPRSNIDVILQRTRVKGVAEGNNTGLKIKFVRDLDDVQLGDRLVSAGLSGTFPKGLVVGEVTGVGKDTDSFFLSINARPLADLERLEEVLILTDKTETMKIEK
ncbi:MAG: rod shape-determining protein MreC [Deltaproteobacteria bacterium]|nr:rod shape-determining protein MreC [Deltaproteobacteria bacterium]